MIRAFHHFEIPGDALVQIRDIMKSEGTFIFNYDNKRSLSQIVRYFVGLSNYEPFKYEHRKNNPLSDEVLYITHPKYLYSLLDDLNIAVEEKRGSELFTAKDLYKFIPKACAVESGLSYFTGKIDLSPSIYLKCKPEIKADSAKVNTIVDIFKCLYCDNCQLEMGTSAVVCPNCNHNYPIENDIFDFRIK